MKTVRRNRIEKSTAAVPSPQNVPQMSISHGGDRTTVVSDTAVVNSNTQGLSVTASVRRVSIDSLK